MNDDLTVQALSDATPPSSDGIALNSAIEFFKGVRAGNVIDKGTLKHGLWFLYTVNEVRPDATQLPAMAVASDVSSLAQQGQELAESMQTPEGTAGALNFLAIMQLVQMILAILKQFGVGGIGGDNGNGGIV